MSSATIERTSFAENGYHVDYTKGAKCCICGCNIPLVTSSTGYETTVGQNNPAPIINDDDSVCCSDCNGLYVIPARMGQYNADFLFALASRMRTNGCTDAAVRGVVDLSLEAEDTQVFE